MCSIPCFLLFILSQASIIASIVYLIFVAYVIIDLFYVINVYRGDTAFCSLECREKQMKQDERKERLAAAQSAESHHPERVAAAPEAETVAAA